MSHKSRFFVYIDQHVRAEIFPSFPYFPALPSKRSTSASGRAAARSLGRTRALYQTVSRSHQSTVTTVRPFDRSPAFVSDRATVTFLNRTSDVRCVGGLELRVEYWVCLPLGKSFFTTP